MSDPGKMVKLILDASIEKGCQIIKKLQQKLRELVMVSKYILITSQQYDKAVGCCSRGLL